MCGLRCCICPPRSKGNDDSQFAASCGCASCWTRFTDFIFVNPIGRISAHVVLLVLSLAAYIIFFLGVFLEQVVPESNRPNDEEALRRFTVAKILLMTFGVVLWVAVVAAWVWICVKQKFWSFEEKKQAAALGRAENGAAGLEAAAGEASAAVAAVNPGFFARAAGSLLHGRNRHSGGSEHGASGADGAADLDETPAWARNWSSNESSGVWDPRTSGTQDPQ